MRCAPVHNSGLSPRGRGKRWKFSSTRMRRGSIPAWAGETQIDSAAARKMRVYPRVGGGNLHLDWDKPRVEGLSPRGRGKPACGQAMPRALGSIPAWAGETQIRRKAGAAARVYPRVGGETLFSDRLGLTYQVYPRVGGGNLRAHRRAYALYGLSPRGRGKRSIADIANEFNRSIPAWAGETRRRWARHVLATVYPRVGGGNVGWATHRRRIRGLSPRGRGKPAPPHPAVSRARSIPAWAGETVDLRGIRSRRKVYPRVGGGNPTQQIQTLTEAGLSPRGRGKQAGKYARPH